MGAQAVCAAGCCIRSGRICKLHKRYSIGATCFAFATGQQSALVTHRVACYACVLQPNSRALASAAEVEL